MQAPTTVSLEAATEAAKDGIELLQTFIKLAKSEKKRWRQQKRSDTSKCSLFCIAHYCN